MRIKALPAFAATLVISGCAESPKLSLYINEYKNFGEFKNHIKTLEKVHSEGDLLVFDPQIDGSISSEYKVIGVDYEHRHGHKGGGICDTLYYREAYSLVNMPDPYDSFVVSYRTKPENITELKWTMSFRDGYQYSAISLHYKKGASKVGYSLMNSEDKSLLYVLFSSQEAANVTVLEKLSAMYEELAKV